MKTISLTFGIGLLAAVALGGCAQNQTASRDTSHPVRSGSRRTVTGSNIPRTVGRPVASSLATTDPYTHTDDVDHNLGVTTPATTEAGAVRN